MSIRLESNRDICDSNETKRMCLCPLEGIIEVVSKKWALQIIAIVGNNGKLRFNVILERLKDVSPKTLADRLKELKKEGLMERKVFSEIPPKVEYNLTNDGEGLRRAIIPLMEWVAKRNGLND